MALYKFCIIIIIITKMSVTGHNGSQYCAGLPVFQPSIKHQTKHWTWWCTGAACVHSQYSTVNFN